MEVGFPSMPVPTLAEWKEGDGNDTETVFGFVPMREVEKVVAEHGGLDKETIARAKQEARKNGNWYFRTQMEATNV